MAKPEPKEGTDKGAESTPPAKPKAPAQQEPPAKRKHADDYPHEAGLVDD